MKRSSVEPWIENVGETGCLEPAFKQNTNDDDDEKHINFYKKIVFSAYYGKNYNSDEHQTEKFGTSDLKNIDIIIFFIEYKENKNLNKKFRIIRGFWKKL